jgi:hypothetical protein
MEMRGFVELAGNATKIAGVVPIVDGFAGGVPLGALVSAWGCVALSAAAAGPRPRNPARPGSSGRPDIIRTVAFTPTMVSVLILAMIVAIRTAVGLGRPPAAKADVVTK